MCFQVGCPRAAAGAYVAPPLAHTLRLDLSALPLAAGEDFVFTRVQAVARSRYPLVAVNSTNATVWSLELGQDPKPDDVLEGRLLRLTGRNNRPFVVQSVGATAAGRPLVHVVRHFSHAGSGISPAGITMDGVEPGVDHVVAERWAWLQPTFRARRNGPGGGTFEDPFAGNIGPGRLKLKTDDAVAATVLRHTILALILAPHASAQCGCGRCSGESSCMIGCGCRNCNAGHYCGCDTVYSLCSDKEGSCPAGKYQPNSGNDNCIYCPAGQYQDYSGQTSCKGCSAGEYWEWDTTGADSSSACKRCGSGKYQDTSGYQRHCNNCTVRAATTVSTWAALALRAVAHAVLGSIKTPRVSLHAEDVLLDGTSRAPRIASCSILTTLVAFQQAFHQAILTCPISSLGASQMTLSALLW